MPRLDKRLELFIWLVVFAAMILSGKYVLNPTDREAEKQQTVRIGYVSWAEGIAMTYLAKVLLEKELGCNVELVMADPAPIFTSLANGDLDFFLDAWLPVTHQTHMDKYGDVLMKLGANYEDARIGLVVPAYVNMASIPELAEKTVLFGGNITGIDSGAGIMEATHRAIDVYGLNMNLLTSSGAAMTASLKDAVQDREPIVVTGWKPHWMFARWDLKFLDDPSKVYGKSENIYTIGRHGVSQDMPEVVNFFEKFHFNDRQIGSLMDSLNDAPSQEEAARAWAREHRELVESWFKNS